MARSGDDTCNARQLSVDEITEVEIRNAIKELKNNKSPGIDKISNELLKYTLQAAYTLKYPLSVLFNTCLNGRDVPKSWKNALIILVYKKGDPTELKNYRPISLLSHLYKLFTKILTKRINK